MGDKKTIKNPFAGIANYFKDVRGEMKKVVWPTYKQLQRNTIIVLISIVLIGIFIWALDLGFQTGLSKFNALSAEYTGSSTTQPSTQGTPAQTQIPEAQTDGE